MENWWSGVVDGFNSKKGANALIGLGSGLLSQPTFAKGLAAGGQGFMQGSQLDNQYAAEEAKLAERNVTMEWVKANYPQYAALPPEQAADLAFKMEAAKKSGSNDPTFFGTPIWGTGEDGQPAFGQLNNQGQFQVTDTGGFQPGKDPIKIDAGTHFVLLDPVSRQPIGQIPKNNEEAAFETALGSGLGKQEAENIATAESVASKMPGLRSVVDTLTSLADTATYTQSGQAMDAVKRELGLEVGQGAIDRASYIAIVDNQVLPLLRDTFGAAFTEREGASLRATLGDPNKSPAEKKAILEAFIAQKERSVLELQGRAAGPGGGQNFVYNPATRKLEPQ